MKNNLYPSYAIEVSDVPDPAHDDAQRRLITLDVDYYANFEWGSEFAETRRITVPVWENHTGYTVDAALAELESELGGGSWESCDAGAYKATY